LVPTIYTELATVYRAIFELVDHDLHNSAQHKTIMLVHLDVLTFEGGPRFALYRLSGASYLSARRSPLSHRSALWLPRPICGIVLGIDTGFMSACRRSLTTISFAALLAFRFYFLSCALVFCSFVA